MSERSTSELRPAPYITICSDYCCVVVFVDVGSSSSSSPILPIFKIINLLILLLLLIIIILMMVVVVIFLFIQTVYRHDNAIDKIVIIGPSIFTSLA